MPTPKAGESKQDYMSRCMAYPDMQGLEQDARFAKCNGMWEQHQKNMSEESDIHLYFIPPESGDAPQGVKDILAAAYSSCRTKWTKEHPDDRENQGNKTSCSQQAWAAVKNAGWSKDAQGNWHKNNTEFIENQTYDIKDVEIFSSGKWNGDEYSDQDLDDMVSSFSELRDDLKPYLKLGHDNKQTLLQKDGMPSAGWITNLKRSGNKLLADLTSVPKKIKDLIDKKAYGRFSSEIYWNLKSKDKNFRRVLKAVALLGGDTPAVSNLNDFINLYTENKIDAETLKNYHELQDSNMELKEMEVQLKQYETDIKARDAEIVQFKQSVIGLEGQIKELTAQIESKEKEKLEIEVKAYIDGKITEGKILPAQKEKYFGLAMKNFDEVKAIVDDMPKLVEFEEKSGHKDKPEHKTTKKYSDMTEEEKDEQIDIEAKNFMKEDSKLTYKEAYNKALEKLGE